MSLEEKSEAVKVQVAISGTISIISREREASV